MGDAHNDASNLSTTYRILINERNVLVFGGYISKEGASRLDAVIGEVEEQLEVARLNAMYGGETWM